MILERVLVGPYQVNCYVLAAKEGAQAFLIDPGDQEHKIKRVLEKHRLAPGFIVNTHGHIDHIRCVEAFGVPVYAHRAEVGMFRQPQLNLSRLLGFDFASSVQILPVEDGQLLELDGIRLEVLHTPGHTPGGICLRMRSPTDKVLFSGDTLFRRGVGRTDFPGADETALFDSIRKKLFVLADDTVVYPGHGPATTIGEEKAENSFLV